MAATTTAGGFTVTENGVPRDLRALQVTSGYFGVYRVTSQVGRGFTRHDEVNGGARIRSAFPVAPGSWTIVAVMPRSFRRSPLASTCEPAVAVIGWKSPHAP